jgi:hypothetical protein
MKCFICKREIHKSDGRHVYRCAKKNNITLDKLDIRYEQLCYNVGFKISKEFFEERYVKKEWSLPDFQKEIGLVYSQTQFLLKYFGIKTRSIKESTSSKKTREKYKETCEARYGVDNASKLEDVKEKKKKTSISNYGVDNIFKDIKFKNNLNKMMMDKYGQLRITNPAKISVSRKIWFSNLSDEEKNKFIERSMKALKSGKGCKSKLESRVKDCLFDNGISFTSQFRIKRFLYDFLIGKNVLLEVNGDFWHANPEKYESNDILSFPVESVVACDIWAKDKRKRKLAESKKYKVIYIWESEINPINDKQLFSLLKDKLWKLKQSS